MAIAVYAPILPITICAISQACHRDLCNTNVGLYNSSLYFLNAFVSLLDGASVSERFL